MIWLFQVIAALILLVGILIQSAWYLLPVVILWIGLFMANVWIPRNWMISSLLFSGCLIAGILSFTGFPIFWLVLAVTAQLLSWDLLCLRLKFDQFHHIEGDNLIIRAHLSRLGMVTVLSLAMAVLSMSISVSFDFGWVLVVGIIALAGLSLVFRNLRSSNREA